MRHRAALACIGLGALLGCAPASQIREPSRLDARPDDFVSIADVDSTIQVELRYFGSHNFMGRPVVGYRAEKCLLTRQAARALAAVQGDLRPYALSLKVYDCYRPQRAVDSFIAWAKDPLDARMEGEFYPRVSKDRIFREQYLLERSGHSRGSTVDLTIVPIPTPSQETYQEGAALRDCALPADKRFRDNSLDFGTGYDCFDALSNLENPTIPLDAKVRRVALRALMEKRGFKPLSSEWWHFTLVDEPYPSTYFDFEIQ
jgi:D-alanyl-D-alanine dipeptidase